MCVRTLEADPERLAAEFEQRLRKIDLVEDAPRTDPVPHVPTAPVISTAAYPPTATATAVPTPAPGPRIAPGRVIIPTAPVVVIPNPVGGAPSQFFSAPNDGNPIPGANASVGTALSDNALLASMVYHIDRIANPDVNPKPGTLDGIRRNDEIHVFVARFLTILR